MARIVGIDFGSKRTGIAATDVLQIIVSAIATVDTADLKDWMVEYITSEPVEKIVIGLPQHKDGSMTLIKPQIDTFVTWLGTQWPHIAVVLVDERFTSVKARQVIIQSGAKKKQRQDKALIDRVSAVIILQQYLGHI
jgi:putative holliday junction resolvase